jgi:hypothetical protein
MLLLGSVKDIDTVLSIEDRKWFGVMSALLFFNA